MSGDVAVVGGGVIGLAVAWRCAQRGMRVTVYHHGSGASRVAAGMLAPVSEAYFGESELTALLVASAALWPGFAEELAEYGDVGYRADGTLVVALTADDRAEAARLWASRVARPAGHPVDRDGAAGRAGPAPRVRGGALVADHQPTRGGSPCSAPRQAAVRLAARRVESLSELDAETVVVAAGCGSAARTGLPVRPVKGQLLRLRADAVGGAGFRHVIRGWADGRRVYVVPRADGEVVVGASEEERTDAIPTAGAVLELLRAATDLVPELTEYELAEVCVGHRPGTPDNAPMLGRLDPRTVVATGHYRHGVLLTPVTADTITELLATGRAPELIAPFTPTRFAHRDRVHAGYGPTRQADQPAAQRVHDRHEEAK